MAKTTKIERKLVLLLSYTFLVGCSTVPELTKLEKYEGQLRVVDLVENICLKMHIKEIVTDACLLKGTYKLEQESSLGFFFRNSRPSVTLLRWGTDLGDTKYMLLSGGLWLPKNTIDSPKIFWDSGRLAATAPTHEEVIQKRDTLVGGSTPSVGGVYPQYVPQGATVLQTSIGYAVASGIVQAISSAEPQPLLFGPPVDKNDSDKLRLEFSNGNRH